MGRTGAHIMSEFLKDLIYIKTKEKRVIDNVLNLRKGDSVLLLEKQYGFSMWKEGVFDFSYCEDKEIKYVVNFGTRFLILGENQITRAKWKH